MAAPYPLPTNLKVLRGTAIPCRMNAREARVTKEPVKMPPGLSVDEKKQWRHVARKLEQAGLLTRLDVQALVMYCKMYTLWTKANANIEKYGTVIKGSKGLPVLSPYFKASMTAADKMMTLLREFGMTPSSRTKVQADSDSGMDEVDEWMKQRRIAREGV
ncbi:hypothetical protein CI610_00341 [invertebrate metagenome]|uniref:Phage terminase small subunit P27 family n=1 Tax=invertebrate metagenome TaxID=1711999 RepID=A0A2H9TBQ5_9ZZZZ